VRYREALASSYNFAAVDVLDKIGVPRLMTVLRAAGVAELPGAPDDYGLRLALGAAKVRLIDLTASYGFLVKDGRVSKARAIDHVEVADGRRWTPQRELERRVVSPATAWMTMDMLADPEARRPGFGMELPLDLPFKVAAKTGTARGFSDTWTVAATTEILVGAWAGAVDGAPTQGIVGMDAAAPLVRDALLTVAGGSKLTLPKRPRGSWTSWCARPRAWCRARPARGSTTTRTRATRRRRSIPGTIRRPARSRIHRAPPAG
jgi:penicillin-binding protein 1C